MKPYTLFLILWREWRKCRETDSPPTAGKSTYTQEGRGGLAYISYKGRPLHSVDGTGTEPPI